ncbi:MAG: hypothetical protein ACJ780_13220 [Solirubrobacteraceae bacterium]
MLATPGVVVVCPPGPPCPVTAYASEADSNPRTLASLRYTTIGRVAKTVKPGHQLKLRFRLNPTGRRLLKKLQFFADARVVLIARAGQGAAVAADYDYTSTVHEQSLTRPPLATWLHRNAASHTALV